MIHDTASMTPEELQAHYDSQLYLACRFGDPSFVAQFLALGAKVDGRFALTNLESNMTPLFITVLRAQGEGFPGHRENSLKIVQLLLEAGADPDAVCNPYYNIDATARQHAKENDGEIFAMIEQWDLGGPGKSGGGKRI